MSESTQNCFESSKLRNLTTKVGSGSTPRGGSEAYKSTGIPLIRSQNVRFEGFDYDGLAFIDDAQAAALSNVTVNSGDVLLNITGASIGRVTQAPEDMNGARVNQHVCIIRPQLALDPTFLKAYLSSPVMQNFIASNESGATRQALTKEKILDFDIPLPPLNEQRRIVARIEELTARSKTAKEALQAIPPLLEKFRQSVLAAAFRGDLTTDWRRNNTNIAEDWFERAIETGRAQLDKLTLRKHRYWGSGKVATDVLSEWNDIPSTWRWVRVGELGFDPNTVVQIGPMSMESKDFTDSGVRVLNVGCVQWGRLEMSKCNHLSPELAEEFQRYKLKADDVMFTRSGTVGRSAVIPTDFGDALMTFHLLRVRTSREVCLPRYLFYAFQGCTAVLTQVKESAMGATRAGFNTKLLEGIQLPLPPLQEQEVICSELESRFEDLDRLAQTAMGSNTKLFMLEQSILAKAFRGELVPHDPNDQLVSELLDRPASPTAPTRSRKTS